MNKSEGLDGVVWQSMRVAALGFIGFIVFIIVATAYGVATGTEPLAAPSYCYDIPANLTPVGVYEHDGHDEIALYNDETSILTVMRVAQLERISCE